MKIKFTEAEGCFFFDLEAETMQEAALLTRFSVNRSKEVRHAEAVVTSTGGFEASVVIGKIKKPTSAIPQKP